MKKVQAELSKYKPSQILIRSSVCCLLHAGFFLDLFFNPKDAGNMFRQNDC
jgi:hypothetical protein